MDVLELQAIENIQREDLHPLEEADSFELLLKPPEGESGYTVDQIADKVSKSPSHVRRLLALCRLIPPAREAFLAEQIVQSTALAIARMPVSQQEKAFPKIMATRPNDTKPVAHKDAEQILASSFMLRLNKATFPIKDATLVPEAGGCNHCPKRTGANPDLFADVPEADTCTDPDCHAGKLTAFNERIKAQAREQGLEVLEGNNARALLKFGESSAQLNGDYVYMDEALEDLTGSKQSLAKLLGTLLTPSALFEHPKDHSLREIVQTMKARDALEAEGLLLHKPEKKPKETGTKATKQDKSHEQPSDGGVAWPFPNPDKPKETATSTAAEEEEDEIPAELVAERHWRRELFIKLHIAMQNKGYEPPLAAKRCTAVDLATAYLDDADLWGLMCNLWGWIEGEEFNTSSDLKWRMHEITSGMDNSQLDLLIADLTLLGDLNPGAAEMNTNPAHLALAMVAMDEDIEIDWRTLRDEAHDVAKPAKTRSTPRTNAPAQGKHKAPPEGPGAADAAPGNTDQAPSAQGMEGQSDKPHWVGLVVQVKGAKRLWKVEAVDEAGDLRLEPVDGKAGSKVVAPSQVAVMPGQTAATAQAQAV
jgi:ParB-like chromosome segregation protein Spo0J